MLIVNRDLRPTVRQVLRKGGEVNVVSTSHPELSFVGEPESSDSDDEPSAAKSQTKARTKAPTKATKNQRRRVGKQIFGGRKKLAHTIILVDKPQTSI